MKNLLVVRLDAIGDFVLWLGAAKQLRSVYPQEKHQIILICNIALKGFAELFPYWDKVIFIDKQKYFSNVFYRWFLRVQILLSKIDLLINPLYSRDYVTDKLISFVRCKDKIGIDGDLANSTKLLQTKGDKIFSSLIKIPEQLNSEIERNFYFLNQVVNKNFELTLTDLSWLPNPITQTSDKYYVLAPGAGKNYRQWEPSGFIELIKLIHERTHLQGIICGSKDEIQIANNISKRTRELTDNRTGQTDIVSLCNLIKGAKFIISNETSAIHIAAALDIPSICVLGGGHFGRFAPYPESLGKDRNLPICGYNQMPCYNCNWKCIYTKDETKPFPCISSISVDQVWQEVRKLLATISGLK